MEIIIRINATDYVTVAEKRPLTVFPLYLMFQGAVLEENDEKAFYQSDSEDKKDESQDKPYIMDPDHRLLLRNTKPLLQSRNTAVSQPDTGVEATHI